MNDTDRKALIEQRVTRDGFSVAEFYTHPENGLTGKIGRFVVISDEYEDDGLYPDDEGLLEASIVGAPQYGNVRVAYSFTVEGYDGGNDVRDLSVLDPAD